MDSHFEVSPYMTAEEAAKYLRMDHLKKHKVLIHRYVMQGRLKAMKRGSQYLFTKQQLDDFLMVGR